MPIKVGTENAVRVYKQQYVDIGVIPPGGYYLPYDFDPSGYACVMGSVATYNGRYYDCRQIEVKEMKNTLGEMIHHRTTISFNSDGGSSVASQVKTWGVENVTQPTNPTRSGWSIVGWATTIKAQSANVTFPVLAPENDTTYYAVWQTTITWKKYNGTSTYVSGVAGSTVYAPTGTPDDSGWDYYWPQNSVVVTGPQTIQETRRPRLNPPLVTFGEHFFWDGSLDPNYIGEAYIFSSINNPNNSQAILRCKIFAMGTDVTDSFQWQEFYEAVPDYYIGDTIPANSSGSFAIINWVEPHIPNIEFRFYFQSTNPLYADSVYSTIVVP